LVKDDDEQLATLLLKWEEAWDLGEDIPAAKLCADLPELTQELADQIKLLKSMNWMTKDAADDLSSTDEVELLIGKTLAGRYQIESVVGFGGHGKVYKAFDPELQRHVAVKVSKSIASEEQSDELLEEARRAAKLKHPNIVAVYDVGRHDGQLFFVTELVDGKNLADNIADSVPSITEAKRIVLSVAEALQFAHSQGFLHRDIKPANILLDKDGRVLVTDFGIATTIDQIENHRGGTPGTLPYMAPEQIAGEVQLIDGRTDVHALGVVLYELLTGQLPYRGRTPTAVREQILFRPPKPLRAVNQSIPKQLELVCLKCLAKHPADRFATASAVIEALNVRESNRSYVWFGGLLLPLLIAFGVWQSWPKQQATTIEDQQSSISKNGAFTFTGMQRIRTPLQRFSPVTLEAWVRPSKYENRGHFVIGSDVPSNWGIGLGVLGVNLGVEKLEGTLKSPQVVPLAVWSHVAAVFGDQETRIYFNGKLVMTEIATNPAESDTRFVVGNVGENNPTEFFLGQIRSVRISEGERYKTDFVPEERFAKDADGSENKTLLIYDGHSFDDDRIVDLSGNGNDGVWQDFSIDD
jgi:serine/threonine protein kinase